MGFFDFVKKGIDYVKKGDVWGAVNHVVNNVKERGSMIFGTAKKAANIIKDGYSQIQKIPVIGNMVKAVTDKILDLPVPYAGVSLKTGLKLGEGVIDVGDKIFN